MEVLLSEKPFVGVVKDVGVDHAGDIQYYIKSEQLPKVLCTRLCMHFYHAVQFVLSSRVGSGFVKILPFFGRMPMAIQVLSQECTPSILSLFTLRADRTPQTKTMAAIAQIPRWVVL